MSAAAISAPLSGSSAVPTAAPIRSRCSRTPATRSSRTAPPTSAATTTCRRDAGSSPAATWSSAITLLTVRGSTQRGARRASRRFVLCSFPRRPLVASRGRAGTADIWAVPGLAKVGCREAERLTAVCCSARWAGGRCFRVRRARWAGSSCGAAALGARRRFPRGAIGLRACPSPRAAVRWS